MISFFKRNAADRHSFWRSWATMAGWNRPWPVRSSAWNRSSVPPTAASWPPWKIAAGKRFPWCRHWACGFPEGRLTVFAATVPISRQGCFRLPRSVRRATLSSFFGRAACRRWTRSPRPAAIWKAENSIGWAWSAPWPACPSFVPRTQEEHFYFHYLSCGRPLASARRWSGGRVSWQ